jgi:16S rRNA (adenine1518-N6/adenine1519-N6)-dimethyltransferase
MLPTTSDLARKYGIHAKKSLGQNFIFDKNFTDKIAKSAGSLEDEEILEIGAGVGSLTRSILDCGAKKLTVIEKDERCINLLLELKSFYGERLDIINGDALLIDEKKLFADTFSKNKKIKIIANLPYNISTPLIIKWLKIAPLISSMTIMLQKEVAEKIVSDKDKKSYGRLSVMVNHLCETKISFLVSNTIFVPKPKVMSAITQIIPHKNPRFDVDFTSLEKLCAAAFSKRRKMIKIETESWVIKI